MPARRRSGQDARGPERIVGRALSTAQRHRVDGPYELIDRNGTILIKVATAAVGQRRALQTDIDHAKKVLEGDATVLVAIGGAGAERRDLERARRRLPWWWPTSTRGSMAYPRAR